MKLRITYILLLLLSLTFTADAQRKKNTAKKPTKAVVKKKQVKKPAAKKVVKPNTQVKDSTDLKAATIEIIQSYKPEVKQAVKPETAPDLPPVDTAILPMSYEVPAQNLNYTYSALPLRPLALGKDSAKKQFANYVRLAGGNLSTLLLDAGIGGLKGRNYYTVFNIRHLSQAGNILYQKSSLTGFDADGYYKTNSMLWHGGVGVLYNRFNLFGYDNNLYNYKESQVGFSNSGFNIMVDAKNIEDEKWAYHPSVNVRSYTMNRITGIDGSEYNIIVKLPFTYTIDTSLKIGLAVNGALSNYTTNAATQQINNYVQLAPSVHYRKGAFDGRVGLYPTMGVASTTYLLPDVQLNFRLVRASQLFLSAGWNGQLQQNTFEQLATVNPFLSAFKGLGQTISNEIYGGLQTNIGNHITVGGKVSYWQYGNMPLFVNDTATDNKEFMVSYDKVNAVSLQGSLRYTVGQTISIGGSIIYTTYDADLNKQAWHLPALRLNADVSIRPIQDLLITGYLTVLDGIYAVDKGNRTIELPAAFDLGAGAEYTFIPRLSAFAQVNNIFNNQYERWYGYRAYGMNIFGGLRLKF